MTTAKPYKHHKKGDGRHVQLQEWFQGTEAWASLKPGPRALYVELKRCFNGSNNGRIFLSYRDAAEALNVHRNTVGPWFKELQRRGLIRMEKGAHLGTDGHGKAAQWALCEMSTSCGRPPDHSFRQWTESKTEHPRTNIVPMRHKNRATRTHHRSPSTETVTKIVTCRPK